MIIVLSAIATSGQDHTKIYSRKIPSFVYGTWEIYRYKASGGTLENPADFIGKKITLGRKRFECQKGFLFLDYPCKLKRYEYEDYRPDEHVVERGIFLWRSEDGFAQREKVLQVCYDRRRYYCYFFEIDKRNHLMIYYDGWQYFLRKTKR
jgi:hypothetical protein